MHKHSHARVFTTPFSQTSPLGGGYLLANLEYLRSMKLRIISLNAKGLINYEKRAQVRLATADADILCLQETHGTPETNGNWARNLGYEGAVFSTYKNNARGSAVMWRDGWQKVAEARDGGGRLAACVLEKPNCDHRIAVISTYAPNVSHTLLSQTEYIKFVESLHTMITELEPMEAKVIVAGDLNIILNADLDTFEDNPRTYQDLVDEVETMCERVGLTDAYRHVHPDEKTYTFAPMGGNKNAIYRRLDYGLVDDNLANFVTECDHRYVACSDHKAVVIQMETPGSLKSKGRTSLWRHNDTFNKDPEFLLRARATVKAAAGETFTEKRTAWEYIKFRLRETSIMYGKILRKNREQDLVILTSRLEALELSPVENNEELAEVKGRLNEHTLRRDRATIFNSRTAWTEENEKCTKYFFRRIAQNAKEGNIIELEENGNKLTKPEINDRIHDFYADLYSEKKVTEPKLPEQMRGLAKDDTAEREITPGELTRTLFKHLNAGKSPGNDGLTVGLYKVLWEEIKTHLHEALKEGLREGELSTSQKQSVIRLIKKKEKKKDLGNLRPISLLNVDTKIYSRLLATRMEKGLLAVIGKEQLAFVKGRNIVEGTRTIDYIIERNIKKGIKGAVVAFDFSKAFDSISHEYLWKVMTHVGFGPNFIQMVKTLYQGAESCVMNNGNTTAYFPLKRSCRQGDSLSPYLFILAIEPLIQTIQNDKHIKGLKDPNNKNAKLNVFADDTTGFISCKKDLDRLTKAFTDFEKCSGLALNQTKSEIMLIGGLKKEELGQTDIKIVENLKITGVTFGNLGANRETEKLNFEPVLQKMRKAFNMWSGRDLSLLGRTLIAKTQGISQLLYLANSIAVPQWVVKEAKKIIYKFIWRGPDKITRTMQRKPIDAGGINMPFLDDAIAAAGVQWLKRRSLSQSRHTWTNFMDADFGTRGGYGYLNAKRTVWDRKKLDFLPFNRYILDCWDKIARTTGHKLPLNEQTVWYNKNFTTGSRKKTAEGEYLWSEGYCTPEHFHDTNGTLISAEEAVLRGLNPVLGEEWHRATEVIRATCDLGQVTGTCEEEIMPHDSQGLEETVMLLGEMSTPIAELTYTKMLKYISTKLTGEETPHRKRKTEELGLQPTDWEVSLKAITRSFIDTKTRSFALKYLAGITYANKDYHRFGFRDTAKCSFCDEDTQNKKHLFLECTQVKEFWDELAQSMWRTSFSDQEKTLGNGQNDFIIFFTTQYIHRKNYYTEPLNLKELKGSMTATRRVELAIAEKRGKTHSHNRKWDAIALYL